MPTLFPYTTLFRSSSGIWHQAILDARVPLVTYRTLADRIGAWPEYVIVLLTLLALAWAGAGAWRARASRAARAVRRREAAGSA